MKLADLNPELQGTIANGLLMFDCPHPGCSHRVRVPISDQPFHERSSGNWLGKAKVEKVWQATGAYPDALTLQPSIDIIEADENGNKIRTRCWHGFITNGEVS